MPIETFPPESEDFYWESSSLVFTAAYHLKRGFCCGSGCRHCPYKEGAVTNAAPLDSTTQNDKED